MKQTSRRTSVAERRENRREVPSGPRSRLVGGDALRGGPNVGPGHAGRRSLRRPAHLLAIAVAVVAATLGLWLGWPSEARAGVGDIDYFYAANAQAEARPEAANESDVGVFRDTPSLFSAYQKVGDPGEGGVSYCMDASLGGPGRGKIEYTATSTADAGLSYILTNGFPNSTVIEGTPHSRGDARAITQLAVWIYNGDPYDPDDPLTGEQLRAVEEAESFASRAKAYAESGGEVLGEYWIYRPADPSAQRMIVTGAPFGGIELTKVSRHAEATAGNRRYTLEGAVFGVFSDEGCSDRVATITTDAAGRGAATGLRAGTYWVKELVAPTGFHLSPSTWRLEVPGGGRASVEVSDDAVLGELVALVQKMDAEGEAASAERAARPQGGASLAGAEFTVRYYGDADVNAGHAPMRTWVFATGPDGVARLDREGSLVSGDPLFSDPEGRTVMPLGTYTVQETKAPLGYLVSDHAVHTLVADQDPDGSFVWRNSDGWSSRYALVDVDGRAVTDRVMRGGIRLHKVDAELRKGVAQGGASLKGARIAIRSLSENDVLVGGVWRSKGEDVLELTTDESGSCATAPDALPYGSYEAREVAPSPGYLLNGSWRQTFTISEDGAVVDAPTEALPEQVVRGDLSAVKADAESQERLSGIPFLVTSLTTGESHVLLTDENGALDTSSEHVPHSMDTNANDAAYDRQANRVDDGLLRQGVGTWFSGSAEVETEPDDARGALPYDSYEIRELRCAANADHMLVTLRATVSRAGARVFLGTIEDARVRISTTLTGSDGEKTVEASERIRLVDELRFEGLLPDREYELRGELHLVGEDGRDEGVVAEATSTFTPRTSFGTTELAFELDASELKGRSLVAFERVYLEGELVASHEDLQDEGQTIRVASPERPEEPPVPTDRAVPSTGEEARPLLALTLAAAAAVGLALALRHRTRRSPEGPRGV